MKDGMAPEIPRAMSTVDAADEYLTIAEVATILKVSAKRVRNLMTSGTFQQDVHFFRRKGIGPRFLRSRLDAWLRESRRPAREIPMARGRCSVAAR